MFSPSLYQSNFFKEVSSGTSSILLDAVAGSGKTTTIVHSTSLLSPHVLTIFLAFNKRIAEELERRVPSFIQVGTFHSRSLRALSRSLPKSPKVNKDKIRDLLKKNLKWNDFVIYGQFCQKLVALAKSAGLGTEIVEASPFEFENLISHFSLTAESGDFDLSRAISISQNCLDASNEDLSTIDFDDMLYLVLLRKVVFDKASNIFVDEAQDTNGVQRALLSQMGNFPTSRLFAVGDPFQSIYGFRGADASAMDLLQSEFSMTRMDLSICYRCSKSVIREAQKYIK